MKDPSEAIRQYLYNILHLTVSYEGTYLPCYSFVPRNGTKPFIVIGEQYMVSDESTKDKYITDNQVAIEIYAGYSGNDASYKLVNSVSDDILELLIADTLTQVGSGGQSVSGITDYNPIVIQIISISTQRIVTETEIVIMKSIVVKFYLEES